MEPRHLALTAFASLLLLAGAFAAVSLNAAMGIAQTRFPDTGVSPQSMPNYPVREGGKEYWVVEFDSLWVPVDVATGTIADKASEAPTVTAIYSTHYRLKKIFEQNSKDDYPVQKISGLTVLQGDAKSKAGYLRLYRDNQPASLRPRVDAMITAASGLETSINSLIDASSALHTKELALSQSSAATADVDAWQTQFDALLTGLSTVVTKGYAYDNATQAFLLDANKYTSDPKNNDTQAVISFANGVSIPNVPSAMPGLKATVENWRGWLDTTMSAKGVAEKSELYYTVFTEKSSGSTVLTKQTEAFAILSEASKRASAISARLDKCSDEIGETSKNDLAQMESQFSKANSSYAAANAKYTAMDYDGAATEYENTIGYSDKALGFAKKLESKNCPTTPIVTPQGFDLSQFLTSPAGIIVMLLGVLLVGLFLFKGKKPRQPMMDQYGSY